MNGLLVRDRPDALHEDLDGSSPCYWRVAPWLPAFAVCGLTLLVLSRHDVPVRDAIVFGAYIGLGVALPGTLLWRALRGAPGPLPEEIAAGTALGYGIEVLTYIPARWLGIPLAVVLWPAVTIAAFAFMPGLRRYWRCSGPRVPAPWAWAISATIGLVVVWSGQGFFNTNGSRWAGYAASSIDIPWLLALAGELKHHVPGTEPTVAGEPLLYHWFVFADVAATGWATGIELWTLLFRLSILPMVAAFAVLIASIARRLTGHWWTGPAALAITFLVVTPNPYGWTALAPPSANLLTAVLWLSPTQSFGAMLFAATALLLVPLLRGTAGRRDWLLLAVMLATLTGAKATYLPLLFVGLCVAALLPTARRAALSGAALTAGFALFAQLVLFRSRSQGLVPAPLSTMKRMAFGPAIEMISAPFWVLATIAALIALGWLTGWAGVFGLLRRRPEATVLMFLATGGTGAAATMLLGHPGNSQYFFLQAGGPYLAVAATCGLAALLPSGRPPWPPLLLAAGIGVLAALLARVLCDPVTPRRGLGPAQLLLALAVPYLALIAAAATAAAAVVWLTKRVGRLSGLAPAMVTVLLIGLGLPPLWHRITSTERTPGVPAPPIADGVQAAGRWLRDHSSPADLVATNAHCTRPHPAPCDHRHFWVSAFSERRMLVEGWAYSAASLARITDVNRQPLTTIPFWDPVRLADNDAAFREPSARTMSRLRDGYGVRWLFVIGETRPMSSPALPRYRSGDCTVYELRASRTNARPGAVTIRPVRNVVDPRS